MFHKTQAEKTGLEEAIDDALAELKSYEATSEEYAKIIDHLEKLYKMKSTEKDSSVDWNQMLAVGGNLAGIIMILGYERANVVASKALSFVLKSKV